MARDSQTEPRVHVGCRTSPRRRGIGRNRLHSRHGGDDADAPGAGIATHQAREIGPGHARLGEEIAQGAPSHGRAQHRKRRPLMELADEGRVDESRSLHEDLRSLAMGKNLEGAALRVMEERARSLECVRDLRFREFDQTPQPAIVARLVHVVRSIHEVEPVRHRPAPESTFSVASSLEARTYPLRPNAGGREGRDTNPASKRPTSRCTNDYGQSHCRGPQEQWSPADRGSSCHLFVEINRIRHLPKMVRRGPIATRKRRPAPRTPFTRRLGCGIRPARETSRSGGQSVPAAGARVGLQKARGSNGGTPPPASGSATRR